MPGLGFLFGALGWLRKAFSAALVIATRYPLQCALVASLLALAAVWHIKGGQVDAANKRADKWHTAWTAMDTAQRAAMKLALAEKARRETQSRTDAERITREHSTLVADNRSAADRFIAANRLRSEGGQCRASAANPAPGVDGAEVHSDLPADAVVVGASDVHSCSDWVAFGMKARESVLTTAAETLAK